MNPLLHLLPAVYAALSRPALTWAGAPVPAFEHLAQPLAGHYVLLEQPTATGQGGGRQCRQWSCTALVDVVTQFPTDLVSSAPADALADQITDRLEGQALYGLPAGYDCGPAVLELHNELREGGAGVELAAVRRLLRFRWTVYAHATAPIWPPAGNGGNYRLTHGGNYRLTHVAPRFT